jgi:hypothetical protein
MTKGEVMRPDRHSYVLESLAVGIVLPLAILFILGAVILHFRCCTWKSSSNANDPTEIIAPLYANESFRHESPENGIEYDIAAAVFLGLCTPVVMLVGAIWTIVLVCGFSLRSHEKLPPLRIDPATGYLLAPPRHWRLQFSMLALILFTLFVAVMLKVTLALLRTH